MAQAQPRRFVEIFGLDERAPTRPVMPRSTRLRVLEVQDPEEEQQDDDQPRYAEDPEKQWDHSVAASFRRSRCGIGARINPCRARLGHDSPIARAMERA